jgi:hypothetical protein
MKKILGLFLLLVYLLFFVGCADAPHLGLYHYIRAPAAVGQGVKIYPVYVDKDYGEADQLAIQQALEQWNFAFNGQAKFVIVDSQFDMQPGLLELTVQTNAFLILKVSSRNDMVNNVDGIAAGECGHGYYAVGFTPGGSHHVYLVRDRLANRDIKYIIMHELGHTLGARHRGDGLMSVPYHQEAYQCVDQMTVLQVAEHEQLQPDHMNYCVVP